MLIKDIVAVVVLGIWVLASLQAYQAHHHGRCLATRGVLLRARAAAADGEPATDEGFEHRPGEAVVVCQPGAAEIVDSNYMQLAHYPVSSQSKKATL